MGRVVKGMGRVVPSLVLDARGEADRVRAETRAAGQAHALVEAAAILATARAQAARLVADAQPAALALAARMAARIVGRAVDLDPAVMVEIAGEALAACRPRGLVKLRAHPADVAALDRAHAALLARLEGAAALELVPDPSVGRYGCVVETPLGRVDARLEAQIAALERAVGSDRG
jgi:flagellar biosynthesis/type III secretory pathway protein FliH